MIGRQPLRRQTDRLEMELNEHGELQGNKKQREEEKEKGP